MAPLASCVMDLTVSLIGNIVKFKNGPDVTHNSIVSHLQSVNESFEGTNCSFGEWLPPASDPGCEANCTRPNITGPDTVSVNGDGFTICHDCNYSALNVVRSNRTQPARCGFSFLYDLQTNSSSFRGYAALSAISLAQGSNCIPLLFTSS
jgi:hypothetical protein